MIDVRWKTRGSGWSPWQPLRPSRLKGATARWAIAALVTTDLDGFGEDGLPVKITVQRESGLRTQYRLSV